MNYFKTSTLYLASLITISSIYFAEINYKLFVYYPINNSSFNIYRTLTYMFVHANLNHLIANIFFLCISGFFIEKRIGNLNLLLVFFVGGILSVFMYNFLIPLDNCVVGCSGGVLALMGIAWAICFEEKRWEYFFLLGIYMIPQIKSTLLILEVNHTIDNIAYPIHVTGFIFGAFFYILWKLSKLFSINLDNPSS